jgi:hypothetical protein
MSLTPEKIAELKEKRKRPLIAVSCTHGTVVFEAPTRAQYDRFIDAKLAGNNSSANCRELAQDCLAFPDRDGMIKILDAMPALLTNEWCDAIITLAGSDDEAKATVKKL